MPSPSRVSQEQGKRRIRKICNFLTPEPCATPIFKKLLVVNRGEIARRIMRGAKSLGIPTVAIYAAADADALHRETADEAFEVKAPAGKEADAIAPYLNIDEVMRVAKESGADAAHPGYGFLAESEAFAAACAANGVKFVGPDSKTIGLFGDKTMARALAIEHGVSVAAGSGPIQSAEEAIKFIEDNKVPYPVLVKAAFGGGGRGQRLVHQGSELAAALDSCVKEAEMAFGDGTCFIEEFVSPGRHIEIQVLGDGPGGNAIHLFERDCSVQLRNQKVVEIAPARDICPELREKLTSSAIALAKATEYEGLGTVEFLVSGALTDPDARHIFLEVEHTITEQITGIDLVQQQLQVAAGATLTSLGLTQDKITYAGWAIQSRVCLMPGKEAPLALYQEPTGDGVRVDTGVAQGKTPSAKYDPLLAKLICSVPAGQSFDDCVQLSLSSLQSYKMDGVKTNINQLLNILSHPEMTANNVYTAFMSDFAADVGNTVSKKKKKKAKKKAAAPEGPPTSIPVFSPFPGQVAEFKVKVGDKVEPGQTVAVVSAMKMLNDIPSPGVGVVTAIGSAVEAQIDETVALVTIEGHVMAVEEEEDEFDDAAPVAAAPGGGGDGAFISRAWAADEDTFGVYGRSAPRIRSKIKTDDATYKDRHAHHSALAATLQERLQLVRQGGGGKYVKLHRKRGKFLARERIEQIIDPGSRFLELSALAAWDKHDGKVMSAGVVTGIGLVHGRECMFQCNDATVKGGIAFPETFKKQSRAQEIAQANRLPCVYLVDGGGANLSADNGGDGAMTVGFVEYGKQFRNQSIMSSMKIPQIACVLGQCTAGGAYVPALSDEVVHVNGGNIYLGGPPLVKAATGEIATQEQLGGAAMHTSKSGVSDHYAENEEEALHKVRTIIEHLQRPAKVQLPMLNPEPPAYSPEELLGVVPEDTKIPFDVREVIARIVDGSRFHEFKPRYGSTIVCGWGHIHGYPIGILGNNGMLFSESAIKAAHFIENCGQRGTPLLFLHNITGFIIGTKYEQGGIAKDGAKMIMAVSCAPVPKFSVVLAGSHGAGNYAMCGPAFDPRFTFLWPNAKISVMGGKQAADVITTVKDGQLKREGKPPLSKEQIEMMQEPIIDAFESTNSAYHSTANVFDDGVIDPRHTRDTLGMAISISLNAPKMTNGYGVFRM